MDDEEFRGGHVVAEIKIGNVECAKRSVFRDGGVEEDIDHRHRGGAGGDRACNITSVSPSTATNSADNGPLGPFFFGNRVIVCG